MVVTKEEFTQLYVRAFNRVANEVSGHERPLKDGQELVRLLNLEVIRELARHLGYRFDGRTLMIKGYAVTTAHVPDRLIVNLEQAKELLHEIEKKMEGGWG